MSQKSCAKSILIHAYILCSCVQKCTSAYLQLYVKFILPASVSSLFLLTIWVKETLNLHFLTFTVYHAILKMTELLNIFSLNAKCIQVVPLLCRLYDENLPQTYISHTLMLEMAFRSYY